MDKKVSLLEKSMLQKNLNQLKKAITSLTRIQKEVLMYRNDVALVDIYRFLRTSKSYRTATDILVHSENVSRELGGLGRSLHEAETVLLQQVQHLEKLEREEKKKVVKPK